MDTVTQQPMIAHTKMLPAAIQQSAKANSGGKTQASSHRDSKVCQEWVQQMDRRKTHTHVPARDD